MGKVLKRLRLARKLTQWDVAHALEYTTAQFISSWERGVSYPPLDLRTLRKLAETLHITARDLVELIFECKEKERRIEKKELLAVLRRS